MSMGRPGNCQSPVLAIENVDVCQPILLDVSFDGIHVSQCRSSPRSHTFYRHVQHCFGGKAFISMSSTAQSLQHQVRCNRPNCFCFPDLFNYVVLSHANTLYPSQHSHVSLIHQHLMLLFHCPAFIPICHSSFYNSLIYTRQVTRATHVRNRVCPRVELILKIIIILLIRFLGFIKSKPC